jgi:anti-repressor protein
MEGNVNDMIFENTNLGVTISTVEKDGKVWFHGGAVAGALGYKNPRKAIWQHCKEEGVLIWNSPTAGGSQPIKYISEGNLYRLIIKSTLPIAEKFENWVFEEVIPQIRKHGLYAVDRLLDDPDLAIKAFQAIKEERQKNKMLENKINELSPKAEFYDTVACSKTTVSMGECAKMLNIGGVGRNNLFALLKKQGILMSNNVPYQRYVDSGYFTVIESRYKVRDETRVTLVTRVTQKGINYLIKTLSNHKEKSHKE